MDHALRRQMQGLVDAVAAVEAHDRRFGLGAQLANLFTAIASQEHGLDDAPERVDVAQEQFESERAIDREITGLEVHPTLMAVDLHDAGRFADFVRGATLEDPSDDFRHAVATVVNGLDQTLRGQARDNVDVDWHDSWGAQQLGLAAIELGGEAAAAGSRLEHLAMHAQQGTAHAYVLAAATGVMQPAGQAFLSELHRDATPEGIHKRWNDVIAAIDATPDTNAGRRFRADLRNYALEHIEWAQTDLERFIEASDLPEDHNYRQYFPAFQAAYQHIGKTLRDLGGGRAAGRPGTGRFD